jgi:hypothetical protein
MTRRLDPNSWTVVRLPERDLAELVLELAAPLLGRLGPTPTIEDARCDRPRWAPAERPRSVRAPPERRRPGIAGLAESSRPSARNKRSRRVARWLDRARVLPGRTPPLHGQRRAAVMEINHLERRQPSGFSGGVTCSPPVDAVG